MQLEQQAIDLVLRLASAPDPSNLTELWMEAVALSPKLSRKEPKPTNLEIDAFNFFRLTYKRLAPVKGCMVELKCFTKHKDWRDILPMLPHSIDRQINERRALADSGGFVAPWPMLSTYLNQRRWEMIYYDLGDQVKTDLPEKYVSWLRKYIGKNLPMAEIISRALTLEQCEAWQTKTGIFAGLDRSMSTQRMAEFFNELHTQYFTSVTTRTAWGNVAEYYQHLKK